MSLEENIKIFNYLGLTGNQAKVFLALDHTRFSTVKEIQKTSKVPRQEIYKLLHQIEEWGFLEKTISRPLRFKAIPIKQAVSSLLIRKNQETRIMQRKAKNMMTHYKQEKNNQRMQEDEPHFILFSKKEAAITERRAEIDNAKISLDFICSLERFPSTINTFGKNGLKALKRHVKIRVIVEEIKDLLEIPEKIYSFTEFPNYQLRYTLDPVDVVLAIFDTQKALISTSTSGGLGECPDLWTDNPCVLSIVSNYFENMWKTSKDYVPNQH